MTGLDDRGRLVGFYENPNAAAHRTARARRGHASVDAMLGLDQR